MVEDLRDQFWSLGRDLHAEWKFKSALTQSLREFRKILEDSSLLEKSIDSNDPSREMAIIVNKENYPQLDEVLFLGTEEGGSTPRGKKRRLWANR